MFLPGRITHTRRFSLSSPRPGSPPLLGRPLVGLEKSTTEEHDSPIPEEPQQFAERGSPGSKEPRFTKRFRALGLPPSSPPPPTASSSPSTLATSPSRCVTTPPSSDRQQASDDPIGDTIVRLSSMTPIPPPPSLQPPSHPATLPVLSRSRHRVSLVASLPSQATPTLIGRSLQTAVDNPQVGP